MKTKKRNRENQERVHEVNDGKREVWIMEVVAIVDDYRDRDKASLYPKLKAKLDELLRLCHQRIDMLQAMLEKARLSTEYAEKKRRAAERLAKEKSEPKEVANG